MSVYICPTLKQILFSNLSGKLLYGRELKTPSHIACSTLQQLQIPAYACWNPLAVFANSSQQVPTAFYNSCKALSTVNDTPLQALQSTVNSYWNALQRRLCSVGSCNHPFAITDA